MDNWIWIVIYYYICLELIINNQKVVGFWGLKRPPDPRLHWHVRAERGEEASTEHTTQAIPIASV